jgi:ribosome-associated heat shock protein Hsp15
MADRDPGRLAQRLDKWLWHARIVKTRSVAAQLIAQGKFKINRERVIKPAAMLKAGDVITMAVHGRVRVLQIVGFSERRGPAPEARALYTDLTPAAEDAGAAPDDTVPTPSWENEPQHGQ